MTHWKRGQAHSPQHTDRVLTIAFSRVTDHPDDALAQIGETTAIVEYLLRLRVVEQGVDGEVPPHGILGLTAEDVIAQDASMLVTHLIVVFSARAATKGRHFHRLGAEHDMHQTETAADDA